MWEHRGGSFGKYLESFWKDNTENMISELSGFGVRMIFKGIDSM